MDKDIPTRLETPTLKLLDRRLVGIPPPKQEKATLRSDGDVPSPTNGKGGLL